MGSLVWALSNGNHTEAIVMIACTVDQSSAAISILGLHVKPLNFLRYTMSAHLAGAAFFT